MQARGRPGEHGAGPFSRHGKQRSSASSGGGILPPAGHAQGRVTQAGGGRECFLAEWIGGVYAVECQLVAAAFPEKVLHPASHPPGGKPCSATGKAESIADLGHVTVSGRRWQVINVSKPGAYS